MLQTLRRTYHAVWDDDCLGLAAQLAFFFFLSLWPSLLFLVALASFFPIGNVVDRITVPLQPVAPRAVIDLLTDQLHLISDRNSLSLLTLGAAVALWSSSTAMVSITGALNRAFDITERRAWWKVRGVALVLTLALLVFVLVALTGIMLGPGAVRVVARWVRLEPEFLTAWAVLRWPVIVVTLVTAIDLVYWAAPDGARPWRWMSPGALVATGLWSGTSVGLRTYVANFGNYVETYGAIGGVMVLSFWLYLFSFALLLGAELNSEIEQAARRTALGPPPVRAAAPSAARKPDARLEDQ